MHIEVLLKNQFLKLKKSWKLIKVYFLEIGIHTVQECSISSYGTLALLKWCLNM